MTYTHDDAGLLTQPIGYWSWATSESVVGYIRKGLATVGITQPQWWVLNQLAESPEGKDRGEVTQLLQGYLGVGDQLQVDIDELIARGLVVVGEPDQLAMTDDGTILLKQAAEVQRDAMARIHDGVSDEQYLTTMKVLQRMIHNTDGKFWHH